MRGLSAIITYVMLIALVIISSVVIYYWLIGTVNAPSVTPVKTDIQVHKYNSSMLKITNIGVTNTSSLSLMNTTAGDCSFTPATILMPGVTNNCSLAAPASGEVRVWAEGVNPSSIYL